MKLKGRNNKCVNIRKNIGIYIKRTKFIIILQGAEGSGLSYSLQKVLFVQQIMFI